MGSNINNREKSYSSHFKPFSMFLELTKHYLPWLVANISILLELLTHDLTDHLGWYPEAGVYKVAELVKKKTENDYSNISVKITLFGSSNNYKRLILDSEITKPLFQNVSLQLHHRHYGMQGVEFWFRLDLAS